MAQELKLHSPVGGESVILQWPLSDVVSGQREPFFAQCMHSHFWRIAVRS